MAHRKEQFDVIETTKPTWHGLEILRENITLQDNCLRRFEIVPTELYIPVNNQLIEDGDGNFVGSFKKDGTVRLVCSDNPEIKIGQPYNPETFVPITNEAFLDLIDRSCAGTNHKLVSIGSVRNRGRIFASFELTGLEQFRTAGRIISAYLNFGNGHDKSSVLWVNTSQIWGQCDNCFGFNLHQVENKAENTDSSNGDIRLGRRHTKNLKIELPAIADLIDRAIGVQAEFQIQMDLLAKIPCDKQVMENFTVGYLTRDVKVEDAQEKENPVSTRALNISNRLVELFSDPDRGNTGENMADVFGAFTDYYSHESSGGEDKMKQIVSSEFSNGAAWQRKHEVWGRLNNPEVRDETIEHGKEMLALV